VPSGMGRDRLPGSSYAVSYHCVVGYPDLASECDSLADGDKRKLREDGEQCKCKDGWGGVNCNGTQSFSCFRLFARVEVSLQSVRRPSPARVSRYVGSQTQHLLMKTMRVTWRGWFVIPKVKQCSTTISFVMLPVCFLLPPTPRT
jgi:hypothetical protein